jgi:integrase
MVFGWVKVFVMREYIHAYAKNLEEEIKRVNASSLLPENKALILRFYEHNFAKSISLPRMERQMSVLRKTSEFLKKDFSLVSKEDYEQFFIWMNRQGYKEGSIWTYKNVLHVFHKWLNNPECVNWFRFKKMKNSILPEQLFDQEDILKLLKAGVTSRDKALLACLWETGARIGEIGNARIKDVSFDEFGGRILLNGKTGMRKVRIVQSAPYVLEWINEHPYSKNINSPLWVCLHKNVCEKMCYAGLVKVLNSMRKKAGIQKPVNPHHFRHSRATHMAQFLTDAQMKEYFGWGQDSQMAARYVHLSGKQVDDAILRMNGLKKKEEQRELLQRQPCPRCKNLNEVNNSFCEKCWLPLTPQGISELQENSEKSQESVVSLMKLIELAGSNPQKIKQAIILMQQDLGRGV